MISSDQDSSGLDIPRVSDMAEVPNSTAGVPGFDPSQDEPVPTSAEMTTSIKGKGRQRLLRGIHRIASSQSLSGLRRARAVSNPYPKSGTALSCVSLAGPSPPQALSSATSSSASPSPLGYSTAASTNPTTSTCEFPFYDSIEEHLVARKIEDGAPLSSPTTALLPADVKSSRLELQTLSQGASRNLRRPPFHLWDEMPHEIQIHIFFFQPKELVRLSRVSKAFHKFCFDGQLWHSSMLRSIIKKFQPSLWQELS